ncbi:MAG: DUF4440 domain-containing protein [Verrucomicrobia bacterium]|nr:DUF4440 domain-containing protein [Verrucomicrobiota bacterium]
MQIKTLATVLISLAITQLSADHHATPNETQLNQELDAFLGNWTAAFNSQDIPALVNLYDEKADVIYQDGIPNHGRQDLTMHFTRRFRDNPKLQEEITDVKRTFLSPTIGLETGVWHNTGESHPTEATHGRYACTLRKKDGQWKIIHDRGWAMPDKDSDGSKIKSRDILTRKIVEYFDTALSGGYDTVDRLLHDDVHVFVNDMEVKGKDNYMERLRVIQTQWLEEVEFTNLHVHSAYFSRKGQAWDDLSWGDVHQEPTIWSNSWTILSAKGRNTGKPVTFRIHADFRWQDDRSVQMLFYYDPGQLEAEMAAQ